ncbi:radical SAM family heme chaperone HemW [Trichothermofontia sp.]
MMREGWRLREAEGSLSREFVTAAYVHIPFCRRRCYYCNFAISVLGDRRRGEASGTIRHYLTVLAQEIRQTPSRGQRLETVFFGGGTPSLLSVAQVDAILTALDRQFGIAATAEISMEIDPGTFDLAQLQGYRSLGVNRFSLGVQAFQDDLLAACGRTHRVADLMQAMADLERAGVENFSLDLISGLPGQTLADWQASLQEAIAWGPAHVSTYDLTIEAGTVFGRRYQAGVAPLPTDDLTAEMYRLAQRTLTAAGYEHYEISNYARSGYQCRHNRVYWENRPFYGFGMGAASYLDGDRVTRPRMTTAYYTWVNTLAQSHAQAAPTPSEAMTSARVRDRLLDTLMLGLRLREGLKVDILRQQFGPAVVATILDSLRSFQEKGWVDIISPSSLPQSIRLTDPEGFLFSNVILTALFHQLDTDAA